MKLRLSFAHVGAVLRTVSLMVVNWISRIGWSDGQIVVQRPAHLPGSELVPTLEDQLPAEVQNDQSLTKKALNRLLAFARRPRHPVSCCGWEHASPSDAGGSLQRESLSCTDSHRHRRSKGRCEG